jgi:hypothetical protein
MITTYGVFWMVSGGPIVHEVAWFYPHLGTADPCLTGSCNPLHAPHVSTGVEQNPHWYLGTVFHRISHGHA